MTISAKIIADSINSNGDRITTFELEFHRYILPEFNTHRLFSRNAASSRAIPVDKAISLIKENTAMPSHWGKNQPGMSAREEHNEKVNVLFSCDAGTDVDVDYSFFDVTREEAWEEARDAAVEFAKAFAAGGYHKQIVNRITEPFSHIKVVCTSTSYDNFFYLRRHPDAQPEIKELADRMWEAREKSEPFVLSAGEWHVPYFRDGQWTHEMKQPLDDALAISASCCAQVSYRTLDDSVEKAKRIYDRLITSKPAHASPMEHQAQCIDIHDHIIEQLGQVGITGLCKENNDSSGKYKLESGNFRNWVQYRQLIDDNACWEYKENV